MLPVKVDKEVETLAYVTKEGVFAKVKKNLSERFRLAFTAPSCSGALFDNIGFLGNTEEVQQILKGTYDFPADIDPATKLLLEEVVILYRKLSDEEVET